MATESGAQIQLTSAAFAYGDKIPVRFTCEGDDVSPPLQWRGAPLETRSFALILDDPDAPRGTWVHWVLYNIPATAVELTQAVPTLAETPLGARHGRNVETMAMLLDNARAKASPEALPHLGSLSLDTRIGELPFFKGKGCDTCMGTGLKGRQGLYEVMFMTPRIRRLILQNVGAAEIRDGAIEDGMLTLRMDGWLKVLKGLTTLEQVIRETGAQ